MSFSTQQRPILTALNFREVLHAYAQWTVREFMNPDSTADVRRGHATQSTRGALSVGASGTEICLPQPDDRTSPLVMYEIGVFDEMVFKAEAPAPLRDQDSKEAALVVTAGLHAWQQLHPPPM
ncbi:hypothetical protein CORC01_10786 [Colletotrichum orchidophilum]|uniref:Uncharacterized protein n=1 Tax=Colletotrichum orchidophilum TaxID=1209926 RepID=A0A1G4AXM5_9PEZI|nr:uncharacterized protein CORC01_10786 [Colletotrichum orchidophilum]OHE93887.1 hypothetical protein CORC01_10786 [Colletotrichum orchidophilum]